MKFYEKDLPKALMAIDECMENGDWRTALYFATTPHRVHWDLEGGTSEALLQKQQQIVNAVCADIEKHHNYYDAIDLLKDFGPQLVENGIQLDGEKIMSPFCQKQPQK